MSEKYEVVLAGGGHNALLVAAYLAESGVNVCVVERNPYVGGGTATRELAAPGFKTDICSMSHQVIQANPLIINDELKLQSKYGLKYLYSEPETVIHFEDGTYLPMWRELDKTLDSIAKFSQKDAEAYKKFHEWSSGALEQMLGMFFSPPPTFGTLVSMLEGTDEGNELLRALMVSSLDIINDYFENEKVKIALTRWVAEAMMMPQNRGTGFIFFLVVPVMHNYGNGIPVGGSGALSESLKRCVLDHGGTVKTASRIEAFKIENGECKGVVLASGKEILASKAVVSSLHIKQMFPHMVKDTPLSEGFLTRLNRRRPGDFQCFQQGLALHEAPEYKVGGVAKDATIVQFAPSTLEEYILYFEGLHHGRRSRHYPIVACLSREDPTRAPEGKHTLYLYEFAPYNLKDGGPSKWAEVAEENADEVLDYLRKHTTNMGPENIIGRWSMSPVQLERYNPAFIGGDFTHLGAFIDQSMGNRPLPGWNYRTPVDKLYMCGASTHPGYGVSGGGRAAVQVVMEDLGIDFNKVIAAKQTVN